ncbi:MAG: efflux RND transporter periplasmic adaptor subunit [Anaerotruncus sp.]|nr:efflux RND transporter periplasmic adaptor subunit [Anaerotruncus sp.]
MKKATGIILGCLVVAGVGGLGYGIVNRMQAPAVTTSAALPDIVISAAVPQQGSLEQTTSFIGTVEPDESVQVFPKVSGTVLRTYYEVGQTVKKGDLLYELDPTDIQLQYDIAAAQVQTSRVQASQQLGSGYDSNLLALKAQLSSAQANLNSARTNLRNYNDDEDDRVIRAEKVRDKAQADLKAVGEELENLDKLSEEEIKNKYGHSKTAEEVRKDLLAQELKYQDQYMAARDEVNNLEDDDDPTLRSYRTAYRNAQIAYDSARNAYNLASGLSYEDTQATVEAGLNAAEVGLRAQAKQLEYTKVYAPIDGVIEQKNVSDNNPNPTGTPAYVVSNKSMMTVRFAVSETVVTNLEVGDTIEIENGGRSVPGTILEIPTAVNPQSGLFNIKASVDSDDILLHTGVSVKIYATTRKANDSIVISQDCLYYDAEQPYVYVYKDGKAIKTEVKTGVSSETQIEITEGLSATDQVITSWHPRLLDGAAVVLQDADKEVAVSAPADQAEPVESSDSSEVASSESSDAQ